MMIPITFGTAVLQWMGVIAVVSEHLTPLFSHIGLTGEGVLAFVTGSLASLYAAIGVMGTLSLDYRSVTIISVMLLISHNLIMESVIQKKAGFRSGWAAAGLRIVMALFAAWVLNRILPADYTGTLLLEKRGITDTSFTGIMSDWALTNVRLLPFMFMIIAGLNILQQLLREFRLIELLTLPVAPLMRVLGLSKDSAFLWIVLNTLGLTYGASVMINEVENGAVSKRDARLLNAHAAMNHSMLEDTLIFVALGIGVFWLMVPRMILALIAVWSMRFWYYWKLQKIKRLRFNHR